MLIKTKTAHKFFEQSFVVLVLFFSTNPLTLFLGIEKGEINLGNSSTQLIWLGVYAIVFVLILLQANRFAYVFARDKLLLFLIGFALFSVLWSSAPTITLRRGIALILTTALGAYLALRFSLSEQLRILSWVFSLAIFLSLAIIFVRPEYGIHHGAPHVGAWRGIYHQNGVFGQQMTLGAIVFLIYAKTNRNHRWLGWGLFSLATIALLFSRAVTTTITFLILLISIPFYKSLWKRWNSNSLVLYFLGIVVVMVCILIVATQQVEFLTNLAGKTSTFSGRTFLWVNLLEESRNKPLLGYGYNGFWLGWEGPSARIWQLRTWLPRHAHNGYLDVLLDLGWVGLSAFVIHFLMILLAALKWLRRHPTFDNLWPMFFLVYILITNATRSLILTQNSLVWILYTTISLTISIGLRKTRKNNTVSLQA